MIEYPIEFLRSADETVNNAGNISGVINSNMPVAIAGRFGKEIRMKLVTTEFLQLGNIIPYIKIVKASIIEKYIDISEYGLSSNDNVILCATPMSGPEIFEIADLCDKYVYIPSMIKSILSSLNTIAFNDKTFILIIEKIARIVKKENIRASKRKEVTMRILNSKRFTRYKERMKSGSKNENPTIHIPVQIKQLDSDQDSKKSSTIEESKTDTQTTESTKNALTPLTASGVRGASISPLRKELADWNNYKRIVGSCPISSPENIEILEELITMVEKHVLSPLGVLLPKSKVIDLLANLLSDKNFCYAIFKSKLIQSRLKNMSKISASFESSMEKASVEALRIIVNEEIMTVTSDIQPNMSEISNETKQSKIPLNMNVLFDVNHLCYTRLIPEYQTCVQRLKQYIGPFMDDIDLSKSFITGSCIAYASSCHNNINDFPCIYTVPIDWIKYREIMGNVNDRDYRSSAVYQISAELKSINTVGIIIKPIPYQRRAPAHILIPGLHQDQKDEEKNKYLPNMNSPTYQFEMNITGGADIDIGVETESVDEFDTIAQSHFDAVKKHCPYAKMKKEFRAAKGYYYQIYTDDINFITSFRKIDIFMSRRAEVLTWHMYPVRGMYTVVNGTKSLFLSASCIYSRYQHDADYSCYFKSMRQSPEEIILKYLQRGFYFQMPSNIVSGMNEYIKNNDKWSAAGDIYHINGSKFVNNKCLYGNFNLLNLNSYIYQYNRWMMPTSLELS